MKEGQLAFPEKKDIIPQTAEETIKREDFNFDKKAEHIFYHVNEDIKPKRNHVVFLGSYTTLPIRLIIFLPNKKYKLEEDLDSE